MPDISMCINSDCPSHNDCYRFKAKPSEFWQSYDSYKPLEGESKCDKFVEINNKTKKNNYGR